MSDISNVNNAPTENQRGETRSHNDMEGCECALPLWKELLTEGAGIAFAAAIVILILYGIGWMFSLESRVSADIDSFIAHAFSSVDPKIFWLTGGIGGVAMLTSSELSKLVRQGMCLPLLKFLFHCCALSIGCSVGVLVLSLSQEYPAHLPTVMTFGGLAAALMLETGLGIYAAKSGLGAPLNGRGWKVSVALLGAVLILLSGFGIREQLKTSHQKVVDCNAAPVTVETDR